MQAVEVKSFLEEKLPGGLSPVKRQQAIYAHLNPWIANGSIHAVTMKFFSSAAWAERT